MQYVAAVSGKGNQIDLVKEQLLQSNPVLEGRLKIIYIYTFISRYMLKYSIHSSLDVWKSV